MSFDLDRLYDQDRRLARQSESTYDRVLARAHDRVRIANRTNRRVRGTVYAVPVTMGLSSVGYSWADCTAHVARRLSEDGFKVRALHNKLYISWAHWICEDVREEYRAATGNIIDGLGKIEVVVPRNNRDSDSSSDTDDSGADSSDDDDNDSNAKKKKEKKKTAKNNQNQKAKVKPIALIRGGPDIWADEQYNDALG